MKIVTKPDPPKARSDRTRLEELVQNKRSGRLAFLELYEKANKEQKTIASASSVVAAIETDREQQIKKELPCWTGTVIAIVEPNRTFQQASIDTDTILNGSRSIVYTDLNTGTKWIFPVPEEYLHVANGILVAEHPNYMLQISMFEVVVFPVSSVDLVQVFPKRDGIYNLDPVHKIPVENNGTHTRKRFYLWRAEQIVSPLSILKSSDPEMDYVISSVSTSNVKCGAFSERT